MLEVNLDLVHGAICLFLIRIDFLVQKFRKYGLQAASNYHAKHAEKDNDSALAHGLFLCGAIKLYVLQRVFFRRVRLLGAQRGWRRLLIQLVLGVFRIVLRRFLLLLSLLKHLAFNLHLQ